MARTKVVHEFPSFSLCRALKANGFPQNTAFTYIHEEGMEVQTVPTSDAEKYFSLHIICSAPNKKELLIMLPQGYSIIESRERPDSIAREWIGVKYNEVDDEYTDPIVFGDTYIDALAKLVLSLTRSKIIIFTT